MHFLYPLFLVALLVLAIPIIVHLFHFRRYKTVLFSSLRFLRAVESERKNQNRLKHLLVLFSRCMAFSALVLAFAIPACNKTKQAVGKASVVIYLDNSFSMGQRNSQGILLETAKQKARDIIKSLGEQAEYQILGNDPLSAANGFTSTSEALRQVDELHESPRSVSAGKVWKQMQDILGSAPNENRYGYIISDFQGSFVRDLPKDEPRTDYKIHCLKLDAPEKGNISVDSAWLENPFSMSGEKAKIIFRIGNYAKEKAEDVNVRLMMDNAVHGLAKVTVEPYSQSTASIEFSMPSKKINEAWLEIDDPENTFDNKLFFSLQPQGDMNLVMQGNNGFLSRALSTNAFFKISSEPAAAKGMQAWYIGDCGTVSGAEATRLADAVRNGVRAIIIPSETIEQNGLKELTSLFGLPEFKEIKRSKSKVDRNGLNHVFFNQVFSRIPENIEMPTVNYYFSTAGSTGSGDAVLSLDNGDPFLIRFRLGKGFLYLFTAPFTTKAGNFVQSSLFLPVVVNCAFNYDLTGTIYGVTSASKGYLLKNNFASGDGNLLLSGNGSEYVPEVQHGSNGQELFIGSYLSKAGFYTLKDKKENAQSELVALNYSRLESDPRSATEEQLKNLAEKTGIVWLRQDSAAAAAQVTSADSHLWRLFIWLAAISFALEVLLLVFWDPVARRFKPEAETISA